MVSRLFSWRSVHDRSLFRTVVQAPLHDLLRHGAGRTTHSGRLTIIHIMNDCANVMIFDDGCQTKFKVRSSGGPAPQGRGLSGFSRGAGRRPCGGKVCRAARSARNDAGARRIAPRHRRDRPHPASKRSPIGSACSPAGWSRSSMSCKRGGSSGDSKTRATVVSTCWSLPGKGRRSFNPLGALRVSTRTRFWPRSLRTSELCWRLSCRGLPINRDCDRACTRV